jgi:predicted RNA-binding protein with PIN domain
LNTQQKLIIDGYNVVYTDNRLRRTACKDLERARQHLIDMLSAYVGERRIQATVVFDGRGGIVEAASVVPGRLQVMYSADNQTADDLILATIRQSGNPRAYIVVSSDMAHIGRPAKALGCEVIGSKRFLDRITETTDRASHRRSREARRELGDTDYWLKQFDEKDDKSQE